VRHAGMCSEGCRLGAFRAAVQVWGMGRGDATAAAAAAAAAWCGVHACAQRPAPLSLLLLRAGVDDGEGASDRAAADGRKGAGRADAGGARLQHAGHRPPGVGQGGPGGGRGPGAGRHRYVGARAAQSPLLVGESARACKSFDGDAGGERQRL